jgi:hypothetical protein
MPYSQPLQVDFENGLALQAYIRTIQSLQQYNSNINHAITFKEFLEEQMVLVFNLTPDLSASGGCGQAYQTGNLRLELKFKQALKETINVIFYTIRDGKIEITQDRQVLK